MNTRRTDEHGTFAHGHKPQRALTKLLFGAILAGFVVTAAVACGDTITNNTAKCGAGTKLVGDTCVSDVADTGGNATPDSGALDTGLGAETSSDAAAEAEGPLEPDEACPVEDADTVVFNCDAKCGALTNAAACRRAVCRTVTDPPANASWPDTSVLALSPWTTSQRLFQRWILRLPKDPWLVWGECDPKRKGYMAPGEIPYAVDTPQPRFLIGISVFGHPSEAMPIPDENTRKMNLTIEPKRYASRITWGWRRFKRDADEFDRLSPSPAQGIYGALDTEQPGCRSYDTTYLRNPDSYIETNPVLVSFVVTSRRAHEPATNIVLYTNPVTCPVNP